MITILTEVAAAGQVLYNLPLHDKTATATKNGSNAPITTQTDNSITLTTAPAVGDVIAITFNATNLSGRKGVGALSAVGQVTLDAQKTTSVGISVAGTFVGTVSFEASLDGTNWQPILATKVDTGVAALTTTVVGLFRVDATGTSQVRARVSAYTSGTVNLVLASTGL